MDLNVPRPMLNSPIHEGVADAELLLKRPMNFTRPMLNSPTKDDAVGNAFYARVVLRVDAWRDAPIVLDEVLSEMCEPEPPTYYEQIMRQKICCNCSTCRTVR